jgi:hypothetical protein
MTSSNSEDTPLHFVSFDYDDTLLCSTHLASLGLTLNSSRKDVTDKAGVMLDRLSASVCRLLETALKQTSNIYVVTNAERGWVEMSAKLFIPATLPVLERCTIISARTTFEAAFGNSPLRWKFYAFSECLSRMLPLTSRRNVLSFGDSHVEREAIRAVTRGHTTTLCKSVKFSEHPSCEQLMRQQELVQSCFLYVFNHTDHLDLQLTVTVTPSAPSPSPPDFSTLSFPLAAPSAPSSTAAAADSGTLASSAMSSSSLAVPKSPRSPWTPKSPKSPGSRVKSPVIPVRRSLLIAIPTVVLPAGKRKTK